jgi:hypothetical protein
MYKASYANGQKWFEWLKMEPSLYHGYRINGDGSHDTLQHFATKSTAKKWVQFMNDNYASDGGREKVFKMTEAEEFLSKNTFYKMNKDDTGYPLCSVYKEKVLPDEQGLCSLCHMHSASITWGNKWATLKQIEVTNGIPF